MTDQQPLADLSLNDRTAMTEAYLNLPPPTERMMQMSERFLREHGKDAAEQPLAEIALAFCKECLGWEDATVSDCYVERIVSLEDDPEPFIDRLYFDDFEDIALRVRHWIGTLDPDDGYLELIFDPECCTARIRLKRPEKVWGAAISTLYPITAIMSACLAAQRKLRRGA